MNDSTSIVEAERRSVPRFKPTTDTPWSVELPAEDELRKMFGTETVEAARGLLAGSLEILGEHIDTYGQLLLALGAETKPNSTLEAMLLIQLAGLHVSTTSALGQASRATTVEVRAEYHRIAATSARTFAAHLNTLRRLRSGPQQTVRVEHVTVQDGGQAVVGNVHAKGGGT